MTEGLVLVIVESGGGIAAHRFDGEFTEPLPNTPQGFPLFANSVSRYALLLDIGALPLSPQRNLGSEFRSSLLAGRSSAARRQ